MGADDLNEEKMDELLRLMRAAVPDTSGMSDAGKVGFVYKFDYDPSESYEKLDVVKFGMSLWTPKGDTTGNPPPDQSQEGQENVQENEHWVLFLPGALGSEYVKKTDLAKAPTETAAGKAGISYPDGRTIFSDENGMLTGATAGKELTQEEMKDQIANGDLEAGDVVYLTGKPAGTNGLLIVVDKELNEDSVHAIRNSAVAKAINAANALIAENQRLIAETQALRATMEGFGLSKICPVDVTDVTEANGMVLGAFEKNASMEGTLARKIERIQSTLVPVNISSECTSDYSVEQGMNGLIVLQIPALKIIFGAIVITGEINNQTVVLRLPVESTYSGACGIGSSENSNISVSLRVNGGELISNHSVNASITNARYQFFINYK